MEKKHLTLPQCRIVKVSKSPQNFTKNTLSNTQTSFNIHFILEDLERKHTQITTFICIFFFSFTGHLYFTTPPLPFAVVAWTTVYIIALLIALLFYYFRMKETFYEILHLVFLFTLKVNLCTLLLWQPFRKTRILVKWDSSLYLRSKSSLFDCAVYMNTAAFICTLAFKNTVITH